MGIRSRVLVTGAVCAFLIASCSSDSDQIINNNNNGEIEQAKSSLAREPNPNVSTEEISSLVTSTSKFAFKLFRKLAVQTISSSADNKNVFISPYSVSSALTMTYAGAKNETSKEMEELFQFDLSKDKILSGFNYLDLSLQKENNFVLNIANEAWGQNGFSFEKEYLDQLAIHYGAGLNLLDFIRKPEPSRITINRWVADNTNGKILDLIPQGMIDPNTRFVLTNAIYFNADWETPFEKKSTHSQMFYRSATDSIGVDMMHSDNSFAYGEFEDCKVIELPYKGNRISMTIILPEIAIDQFCIGLDEVKMDVISRGLKTEKVILNLPKFSFDYNVSLEGYLMQLGMKTAFTSDADFSGITKETKLLISKVLHKAYVSVDEKGTEAAAATAVLIRAGAAMPTNIKKMTVDKPFVFVIKDNQSGVILFIGKINSPKPSL